MIQENNSSNNSSFDYFFQSSLNEEQQKVVAPKNGVLLVCAGAGSGKTRVITSRITALILKYNIIPHEILALTFTNKAAREMKERVNLFLPDHASLPFVGTFHSYCLKLLKSNPTLTGFPNFSLLNEDDRVKIINNLLQKHGLKKKLKPKHVLSFISKIKNDSLNKFEVDEYLSYDNMTKELYYMYEQEKRAAHCLDFDDLLIEALNLFNNNPEFKEKFQKGVRHILVDEYQDTNKIQHAFLKALCLNSESSLNIDSLCVVGDEDQSIYSWRGANVSNIVNFKSDFPDTVSVTIEQNYRSVEPILNLANNVIKNNKFRYPKHLWSDRKAKNRISALSCYSGYQESKAISIFLKESSKINSLSSHAILYRSHFQSRAVEEALIRESIPYAIIGGIQFYDRLEIKDMLAYLRLIVNPFDRLAFSRVINTPLRGLGPKFEELFFSLWDKQPLLDFKDLSKYILENNFLTNVKQESLKNFIEIFDNLDQNSKASEAIEQAINKSHYYQHLIDSFEKEDAESKKENLKEFISSIIHFEEKKDKYITSFLEEVSLLQDLMNSKDNENQDKVSLMTLHAAKGLEFDNVILSGLEEGILPSSRSLYQTESLEEERRLLYVGITRARERLLVTHANYRYAYGKTTNQMESRFLSELSENYVTRQNCCSWEESSFKAYFSNWLLNSRK